MNMGTQQTSKRGFAGHLFAAAATAAVIGLAGCSAGLSPAAAPGTVAHRSLSGIVHGGQQPIVGAHVYLLAANATGYGGNGIAASASNASTSLLSAISAGNSDSVGAYVLTAGDGSFTITGDYTCTSGQQVYLYALGGNPGAGTNSASGLIAILGTCPVAGFFPSALQVWINEVSTVAASYAFAGFATDATHISSSGTALANVGIANAFANAANLASLSTGATLATTPAGNGTVPLNEINTLANILAACINSSSSASTPCTTLFANAKSAGATGTTATDTATAIINIAHNPSANVAVLFTIPPPTVAFAPSLAAQPNDFTVALKYTGGGIATPQSVAIDGAGNVWVPSTNNSVALLNATTGSFLSGSGGYTSGSLDAPVSIAVGTDGAIWIANCGKSCSGSANASSVTRYVPSGSSVTASNFTAGGLNATYSIAVDGFNRVWAANTAAGSITLLNSSGAPQSGVNGYSTPSLVNPISAAVDTAGFVWTVDSPQNALVVLNASGSLQPSSYTGAALSYPSAVAIDHTGRAWIANQGANSVAVIAAGAPVGSAFTGAGITSPDAIALDGAGAAWLSNMNASISELSSAGSPQSGSFGFTAAGLTFANGIAIDPSGNVWVSNCGSYCSNTGSDTGSVFQFVGAGAPTSTPLASAAANNTLGAKP